MNVNKKLMRKWIDMLRSRRYKQGQGCLRQKGPTSRSVDRYCCLGVACDMIDPKKWEFSETISRNQYYYDEDNELASMEVRSKLGITENEQVELSTMNDGGKKFYEIADYLERTYL